MKVIIKKILLIPFLICSLAYSQTQIGSDIDGTGIDDHLGTSVAMSSDGNVIAVGAPNNDGNRADSGLVRVYENIGGTWTQVVGDINGEAENDLSGTSVALSYDGNIVAIGAPKNDGASGADSGHVRVYENQNGTWVQVGNDIDGKAAGIESGTSVALSLDGSIVVIGAPLNGTGADEFRGQVSIYENQNGTWVQKGSDLNGEAAYDEFGTSVSISTNNNIIAVGAPGNGIAPGANSGHVRVFQYTSTDWVQMGNDIDGTGHTDQSGSSISLGLNGHAVAIGAVWGGGNGIASGRARIYRYNQTNNAWYQDGNDIEGDNVLYHFGTSVSLSQNADVVAIGAIGGIADNGNGAATGQVRIYKRSQGTWDKVGSDIDGENSGDRFGTSVSLSLNGNTVAIGGISNDEGADDSGHVRVYDLSAVLSSDDFVISQFAIFPNPVRNTLQIKLNAGLILEKVHIYNTLGQMIKEDVTPAVDVSSLSNGVYFAKINTDRGEAVKKFIVE